MSFSLEIGSVLLCTASIRLAPKKLEREMLGLDEPG